MEDILCLLPVPLLLRLTLTAFRFAVTLVGIEAGAASKLPLVCALAVTDVELA